MYATFMPNPITGVNGSGMHTHQSLFQGDRNAFYDPSGPGKLSTLATHSISGLLNHAPALTLVTNQWVNSYKRLVPGYEAPVYISWARVNRSDLIRVPSFRPGRESSVRIEYRAPDPACNPYLAFSVMLAAGFAGIENEYEVPPPVEENVFAMGDEERARRDIGTLPRSLHEAIKDAESSELVRSALEEHVFKSFIKNKKLPLGVHIATVIHYNACFAPISLEWEWIRFTKDERSLGQCYEIWTLRP